MRIKVDGTLTDGVTSKDIILHIIGHIGTAGGNGSAIEYCGTAIEGLSMEARMSIVGFWLLAHVNPDHSDVADAAFFNSATCRSRPERERV